MPTRWASSRPPGDGNPFRDQKRRWRVESERAYCASFRPHVQVQTERTIPSPIFVAAMLTVARLRSIHLPDDALATNDEARNRFIKTIIIDHWRENNGRVPSFGGITGYVLVLVPGYGGFDFGSPFTIAGDRAGSPSSPNPGAAWSRSNLGRAAGALRLPRWSARRRPRRSPSLRGTGSSNPSPSSGESSANLTS
jgi:hypothetical protein